MLIQIRFILLLSLTNIFLISCTYTSTGKPVLPQDGPTMANIYREHMQNMDSGREARPDFNVVVDRDTMYSTYADDARQELDQLFPVLPNPTLVIYVHPHLAGEDLAPVPGYYTSIPLTDRTHYALPGEVKPKLKNHR